MKQLLQLLAACLLLKGQLFAQTDPIKDELNHIFQFVNKAMIPTGYLDESGPQFVEKKYFNGTLSHSNMVQEVTLFGFCTTMWPMPE
jgi:hypothetical protein